MRDQPKLSICIGTFNRIDFIGETLDSIFSQNSNEIEVIVVDGGSNDGTENLMKEYLDKYSNFKYLRLPSKGGFDEDYSFAVDQASGDYCWLFSDDDIIKAGAIKYLINELNVNYDAVIVNSEIKDVVLAGVLKDKCINLSKNQIFSPIEFESFFRVTAAHSSFIGSVVVKRSIWNLRNKSIYFGTLFVHVGVLFQTAFDGKVLVIADPLVSIRYGNAMWTVRSFEVSMIIWPRLIWGFEAFSSYSKKSIVSKKPWQSISRLMFYRARGSYSLGEYKKFLKGRLPIAKQIMAYLIAIFPGKLLNFIFYVFFFVVKTRYANAPLILVDLKKSIYYFGDKFFARSK